MDNPIEHLRLVGNESENYYQLGVIHREEELFSEHPSFIDNYLVQGPLEHLLSHTSKYSQAVSSSNLNLFKAYAEGLQVPYQQVVAHHLAIDLKDLLPSFRKNIGRAFFGCATFLYQDAQKAPQILRVLDVEGGKVSNLESQLLSFTNMTPVYQVCPKGSPFPLGHCYLENGLYISVHDKRSSYFYSQGESIYDIVRRLLQESHGLNDALQVVRTSQSLSAWSILVVNREGEGFEAELRGDDQELSHFSLQEQGQYFQKGHLSEALQKYLFSPTPFYQKRVEKKESLSQEWLKHSTHKKSIQERAQELPQFALQQREGFRLLGPHSAALCSIDMQDHRVSCSSQLHHGYYQQWQVIENCFQEKDSALFAPQATPQDDRGAHLLYQAAHSYPEQLGQCYHYLQLANTTLENPELKTNTQFFFLILQVIHQYKKNELNCLYRELQQLSPELPDYLKPHGVIFLRIIERLNAMKKSLSLDDTAPEELHRFAKKIDRWPWPALLLLKKNISLDLAHFDIHYPL